MTTLIPLTPAEAAEKLHLGRARLIDIREPDEFARRHITGAVSRPLSALESQGMPPGAEEIIFTCRSGMRTEAACGRLAAISSGPGFVLKGGVDAWAAAGLPVEGDPKAPLELMRQVQIAAGMLVLAGTTLGFVLNPAFFGLAAFVGAGLTFAGVTGFCGMARVLQLAPWNRASARG